ncbi:bifunctional 3-(3-hydroxy-phenyl)propionate/3-hydroxycinnamic acid hydroxylase [Mesorhizobium sp. CAU 1741]|uniref:bifunctional 3-(3-hydroxy-phenyl)propionate/3-hydroxycinnamic acid hydroxylase n=1 Tax=Mesorhizobium sp. CAU 1741 TaxID=3140366 RepID=UPI00325BD2F3
MTSYPARVPVVIVGAGPTGLTAANLLAAYGVECLVLDREPGPMNLPRAIVLDDEGARTLQVFGLDESYVKRTTPAIGSKYFTDDGNCFAETGAGAQSYGFAKRQYIYQPELEDALREGFVQRAPGRVRFSSNVVDIADRGDHAVVHVEDADGGRHQITTDWVLACDGGRSPIRERLNIRMSGTTYHQDWIVIDMSDDPDRSLFSKFFCSSVRPTVSVPAPNGGRRYEFMVHPGETREQVLQPDFLAELLKPYRPYREEDVLRKTVYTFHARIAERFRQNRILLLGDAAHLTPPFAGQGMNAGLRDAHNVAWKVAATFGGADAGILDTYDAERRKPAWDMILVAVTMGSFVMPASAEELKFRDMLLKALDPFPAVRDYLIQMRFKPKPRYHDGLFLDLDDPELEASLVGEMIPQPTIGAGERRRLLDRDLGPGFALVSQSEAGRRALDGLDLQELFGLPLAKFHLDPQPRVRPLGDAPVDERTRILRPLLTHRDQIMLVRPDRYCAAAFQPDSLGVELARYSALCSAASRASSDEIEVAAEMSASL